MLDFDKPFTVDTDASGSGFGAVLHQGAGPLAFFSRPFAARHLKLAAYEHELIGVVQAVRHWRPYLWGRHFVIRTDHFSLKYLLDHRLSTVPQHQWISKLFGFDFDVEYRPGHLNTVADALSRKDAEAAPGAAVAAALSGPSFAFLDKIRRGGTAAPDVVLQERLRAGSYRRHGTRMRVFCCTVPASLCPTSATSVTRPSNWRMALAMRAPRRRCIGSRQNSIFQATEPW
jgi:hypothetical protein